jgi:hypothetical protein
MRMRNEGVRPNACQPRRRAKLKTACAPSARELGE